MRIDRLVLNGFRNYEWETAEFCPETNVITGPNAQGKTNLLEAVYLLSCGRSFRTRFDKEIIGFSYSGAQILAGVFSYDREQNIDIRMQRGAGKKITVNGVRKTAGELSETLNTVLFCPDDLNLVRGGAAVRRRFLDNAICQIRPQYAELLSEYNRLQDQKTAILQNWRDKPSLLDALDEFSDGMCRVSARMIRYRASYVQRLQVHAAHVHGDFSGKGEQLSMQYVTVSTVTDMLAPEKEIYYQICEHQESHRRAEIESGQCLTGIHKDDLLLQINNCSAREYASQGQTRTASLSLKLAEREIILEETGEYPVLLLDDVLSELDARRQEFVLNRIGGGQTLITCCEDEGISNRTGGKVLFVEKGKIH